MEAKELRIGNFISYRGEKDCIVSSIGSNGFETIKDDIYQNVYGSDDLFDYKPIPLTEDWLINFGFEKCDSPTEQGYTNGKCFMFQNSIGKFNFCLLKFGDFFKRIKYVHQLQNLYFALTGEELEIK